MNDIVRELIIKIWREREFCKTVLEEEGESAASSASYGLDPLYTQLGEEVYRYYENESEKMLEMVGKTICEEIDQLILRDLRRAKS